MERFCLQGSSRQLRWELGEHIDDLTIWGSFCKSDADTGRIESARLLAPAAVFFSLRAILDHRV